MNTCTFGIPEKSKISMEYVLFFLPFEKCAEHFQYFMKVDTFVPFGRQPSGKVIIQVMTDFVISKN